MLRTNSKKAIDNLKKWIIDNFNIDAVNKGDIIDGNDFNSIAMMIYKSFCRCSWNCRNDFTWFKSEQNAWEYCMAGLPSFLGTYKYYYSGSAIDVLGDILEQTEEERNRYTEAEAEKCMTYLLYRTIKKGVIDKFLEA